ncbi:MAG: cytochrome P450 [Planctomycetaceae bacterium]
MPLPEGLTVRGSEVDLDPRHPAFVRDPYPFYAALRDLGRVFRWKQLGHRCCGRYDDVNALLRDRRFGRQILHVATREELGWPEPEPHLAPFHDFERHSLLELEPPRHTRLRGFVNAAFLPRRVENAAVGVERLAHGLIDGFEAAGSCDLVADYAAPLAVGVIADFLGVPRELGPRLLAWSHDMVAIYQARRDRGIEERTVAATGEFSACMREFVAARRHAPADDLLSHLVSAVDGAGSRMTDDEIVTMGILLLNAGHEATVHALGNGVRAILEHVPGPAAAVVTDPAGHVEEMLRIDPPLHMFTRYALEDVEVAGERFRRGEVVGLLLGSANRDPARFSEPDRFDAGRSPNPHVAFGAGIHVCVGAPLARLEMQVALRVLWERLPGLALAEPPRVKDAWHFRGLEALRLAW